MESEFQLNITAGVYCYGGPQKDKIRIKKIFIEYCCDRDAEKKWASLEPLIQLYLDGVIMGPKICLYPKLRIENVTLFRKDYDCHSLAKKDFPKDWNIWVKREREKALKKMIAQKKKGLEKLIKELDKLQQGDTE